MITNNNRIIFIGPLPPPIHGMSSMNKAICDRLLNEGISFERINTAAKSLDRHFFSRISKLPAVIFGWFQLVNWLFGPHPKLVYISIAGGLGQIYDLFMISTARLFGARIIFHHHTFAFLLQKNFLSKIIFFVAGKKAKHITLCNTMAAQLEKKYQAFNILVVSNLATMPLLNGFKREKLKTVGFIGNITVEKGGLTIIKLAKEIGFIKLPIKIKIAGPCPEPSLSEELYQANKDGILEWIGPVYGDKKMSFFSSIDVLIMPTQYPNEAEPLVVWEAMGTGSPVIAYDRGCISEQIKKTAGMIISEEKDFVAETLKTLEYWLSNPVEYSNFSKSALKVYRASIAEQESGWYRLLDTLTDEEAR